jgi:uncharacterized protein (DUF39 family)
MAGGTPKGGAGTLAVTGDLKLMKPEWLLGVHFPGYGTSLRVGIGVPIPILDLQMAKFASVRDSDLFTQIVDYSDAYPNRKPENLGEVSYAELKSGRIRVTGKDVPAHNISNCEKAARISGILKDWILRGKFHITEPLELLPSAGSGYAPKSLE